MKSKAGPAAKVVAGWKMQWKAHLVRVQEGMADDVFADVGRWGQAVQPVEQLYTGDVMLPGLLVQLIPKHMSHSLQGKGGRDHVSTGNTCSFLPHIRLIPAPLSYLLPKFAK
jgi:hypothetical protein